MKKFKPIPVGPPATDADALIDSMGVTKEDKERVYRIVNSGKRRPKTIGKPDAGTAPNSKRPDKSASKRPRKRA